MTVEADIYALLGPLVGNRVFPDDAPLATVKPYITYQQVGGEALFFVENTVPSKQHGEFQVNVWDSTRTGAAALALLVEAAFVGATAFQARPVAAPIAQREPDLNLYGTLQDFSIWSNR